MNFVNWISELNITLHVGWLFLFGSLLLVGFIVFIRRPSAPLRSMPETALRQNKERLQLLIDRMPLACITWNVDFTVMLWNPEAENIFGYAEKDALGKHAFDLIVPENIQPFVQPVWDKLMQGDVAAHNENNNVTQDGRTIICDWFNLPLKNDQGEAIGVISMVRDVTVQKKAQAEARHQTELLQTMMNAIPAPIFFKDTAGIYQECNSAFAEFLGFDYAEIVGHTVYDIAPPEKAILYDESDRKLLEQGGRQSYEAKVRYADGADRDIVFHKAVFTDSAGKIAGQVGVMLDVSERKLQEVELAKYRSQLEALVVERTSQLEDAQHELVAKERLAVLGQLTATVSHELRNPLGTVKNAIYLLGRIKGEGNEKKIEQTLTLADRNVSRCDNIINELLDFTRQQDGTAEEIDLALWVQTVLDEQSLPKDIALMTDLPKGVIVSVNPERFRRAFINVFTNAVQAFEGDDVERKRLSIILSLAKQRVQLVVTDNGSGISDDVMARIFEPMFSTKSFGVGLGMAIVKNIMEEQGGGVALKSRPGEGTSVSLWLPQCQAIPVERLVGHFENEYNI